LLRAFRPALALLPFCLLAACYNGDAGDSRPTPAPSTEAALLYPGGIVSTPDATTSIRGVYPVGNSDAQSCCWLGQEASFRVSARTGVKNLKVTIFEPTMGNLAASQEMSLLDAKGKTLSSQRVGPGLQTISLALPADAVTNGAISVSLRMSTVIVPKSLGINADPRQLSLILRDVSAQ
jgi:hypothetical protein